MGVEEKAGFRYSSEFLQGPDGDLYELFKETVNEDFQISKLNAQLHPVIINKLKVESEDGKIIYLLNSYVSEEGIYLLAQRYFNRSKEIVFYTSLLDKVSLEVISPFTAFKTVPQAKWTGTQFQAQPISADYSRNGRYLAINALVQGDNHLLFVLDRENQEMLLEESTTETISDLSVSDLGILRYQELEHGPQTSIIELLAGPTSRKLVTIDLHQGIKQEFLIEPEEGNIDYGFAQVNKDEIYGYSCFIKESTLGFSLINSDGNSDPILLSLPRELADQYVPRKDRSSWLKKPISLGISAIKKREDGSFLIVSEFLGFSAFSPSTFNPNIPASGDYTKIYAGNIVILNLSPEGELEWHQIIKKDQETTSPYWISCFPFMSNGIMHIIYNDLPEHLTLGEDEEPRTVARNTGDKDILLVRVDEEGEIDKGIFLPLNGDDKKLDVQGISNPSLGTYILSRTFQKKRVLGKLKVN